MLKERQNIWLSFLKKYGKLDYPVCFDFEEPSRRSTKLKKKNTKIIKAFCDYMRKAGYDTIVYSDSSFLRNYTNYSQISKYGVWVARWTYNRNKYKDSDLKNVKLWQYTNKGKIKGISGRVDMNVSFISK